ncbi:MAG: right-handed parallel beta-helix repeat-containing protein [Polyangiaceae bacterium]|nr:right-handed parallel beta-helix repeat-containing protein [Polyangiaceae bacterium]
MNQSFPRLAALGVLALAASASIFAGCGDDDDDSGNQPQAGTGGVGGKAGSGGTAGSPAGAGGAGGTAGSGGLDPCVGIALCERISPSMSEKDIKEKFILATEGTVLAFEAGTYRFLTQLSLTTKGVTVRGAGRAETILDFKIDAAAVAGPGGGSGAGGSGPGGASEAILVTGQADNFVIEHLSVRDSVGDAIKVLGRTNVTFRDVGVSWTGVNATEHGAYGLYPVQCTDVLIEDSEVSGASDAGIYVGQSNRVVVRRNYATKNVAGIEIENTTSADVYENTAEGNTGGLLVFSLPGLEVENGGNVRAYNNKLIANNENNFAPPGNIVGLIPAGTGAFVMANHDVEFFGNEFKDNKTTQFAVISYLVAERPDYLDHPNYAPFPTKVYAHNNTFAGGGTAPDASQVDGIGILLSLGASIGKLPSPLPPLMIDGILPTPPPAGPNPLQLCFSANTGATGANSFANLRLDTLKRDELPTFPSWLPELEPAPYVCTLPALPAVSIPQITAP